MKSLTVLIPAYNEEKLVEKSVLYYYDYLKNLNIDFEIIICINASTDNTIKIAEELSKNYRQIRYMDIPEKGLGIALTKGILSAKKKFTTFMPADAEIKAEFMELALSKTEQYQYISASRRLTKEYRGKSGLRRLANRSFSAIVAACFKFKVTEVGTVRLWHTSWAQKRANKFRAYGFEWQIEQLYWAMKDNLNIIEVPVYTQGIRPASESNVRIVQDTFKLLGSCLKYGIKLRI